METSFPNKSRRKNKAKKPRGASARVAQEKTRNKFVFPKKIIFGALGIGVIYLGLISFYNFFEKLNAQRIETIVLEGNLDYVSEAEIKKAVFGFVNQSLVVIKLDEIKLALETNPWIKGVSIQREWPSTLIINVSEEMAIARWGEEQLLNTEGELFSPKTVLKQTHLPYLSGPEGREHEVMEQYQQFNELLYRQGLGIAGLSLNSRGAWTLKLGSGAEIKIGKEQMMERMHRFVESLDAMFIGSLVNIKTIDLRYHNGIAVSKRINVIEDVVSL